MALHRFPAEKVPANVALHRHLLEFVISWSASEVAPGGPASVPCGEGAGQIAAVTFSVVGVLTGLEAVCRRLVLLWLLYFGMVDQIRMAVGMGEEMGLEG